MNDYERTQRELAEKCILHLIEHRDNTDIEGKLNIAVPYFTTMAGIEKRKCINHLKAQALRLRDKAITPRNEGELPDKLRERAAAYEACAKMLENFDEYK